MPVAPAELTAHLTIDGPPEAREAALRAAGPSQLAREAGPDELMLAGPREEVVAALGEVMTAALDAGARGLDVRLEAPAEARR